MYHLEDSEDMTKAESKQHANFLPYSNSPHYVEAYQVQVGHHLLSWASTTAAEEFIADNRSLSWLPYKLPSSRFQITFLFPGSLAQLAEVSMYLIRFCDVLGPPTVKGGVFIPRK